MRSRTTTIIEGVLILGATVALSWQSVDAFASSNHSAPKSAPVSCASAPVANYSAPAVGKKSAPVGSHSAPCDKGKGKDNGKHKGEIEHKGAKADDKGAAK